MRKSLNKTKNALFQANYILFCVFTSLFLILLGLETHQKGFVSRSFSLTIFLGPIFFTGLILAFTGGEKNDSRGV